MADPQKPTPLPPGPDELRHEAPPAAAETPLSRQLAQWLGVDDELDAVQGAVTSAGTWFRTHILGMSPEDEAHWVGRQAESARQLEALYADLKARQTAAWDASPVKRLLGQVGAQAEQDYEPLWTPSPTTKAVAEQVRQGITKRSDAVRAALPKAPVEVDWGALAPGFTKARTGDPLDKGRSVVDPFKPLDLMVGAQHDWIPTQLVDQLEHGSTPVGSLANVADVGPLVKGALVAAKLGGAAHLAGTIPLGKGAKLAKGAVRAVEDAVPEVKGAAAALERGAVRGGPPVRPVDVHTLEALSTDEAMGVKFPEDEPSHFPDGSDAVVCTNCAEQIIKKLGRGEVYGWSEGTNPTSVVAGPEHGAQVARGQGHDFAVIDGRYLVDPWAKNVEMSSPRAAWDLQHPADRAEVLQLYGDPTSWMRRVPTSEHYSGWIHEVPSGLAAPAVPVASVAPSVQVVSLPHGTPPAERVGGRLIVSGRVPTSKPFPSFAEGAAPLTVSIEDAAQDPGLLKKLADQIREAPMMKPREVRMNDRGVLDAAADRAAQNMHLAIGRQDPDVVLRSSEWYPGGHRIGNGIAERTGVTGDQGIALLASQSPSKEWPQNIELAQRLSHYWKTFGETDPAYAQEYFQQFRNKQTLAAHEWVKANGLVGEDERVYRAAMRRRIADAKKYIGVRWEDLPLEQRAQLIRAHSELYDSPHYPIYGPEGMISHPVAMNADGTPRQLVWQSYENLGRGLAILDDGSPENISRQLGGQHKVRSFFNNLSVPSDPRFATVDTHHVGLSHMRPMGGNAPEVRDVFGRGKSSAATGIKGAHPVYRDAVVLAAAHRGEVPSTTQAIGWDSIKGIFSPAQRRDPVFRAKVEKVWKAYASGRLTLEDVHARIAELAGKIRPPDWIKD